MTSLLSFSDKTKLTRGSIKYFEWCYSQGVWMLTLLVMQSSISTCNPLTRLSLCPGKSHSHSVYTVVCWLIYGNGGVYHIRSSHFMKTVKPACDIHVDNRINENAVKNFSKYINVSCLKCYYLQFFEDMIKG